jgi:hypothetical protein
MLAAGWWAPPDQSWRIYSDGRIEGEKPEGERVGIQIHGLIDLSVSLADVAAEFVAANGNPEKLKDFWNLTMGEESRDAAASATVSVFRERCVASEETDFKPAPARIVPKWASRLVMTVDTQKGYFWFSFAPGATAFAAADPPRPRQRFPRARGPLLQRVLAVRGRRVPGDPLLRASAAGDRLRRRLRPHRGRQFADRSGLQWCLKDPTWRFPIKGASKPSTSGSAGRTSRTSRRDRANRRTSSGCTSSTRLLARPAHRLHRRQDADRRPGDRRGSRRGVSLAAERENDEEYNRHLSAVHKVRKKKGRTTPKCTSPKPGAGRYDYHALEAYQVAWAHGPARCESLPSPAQMLARAKAMASPPVARAPGGLTTPDGRPFLATQRKP